MKKILFSVIMICGNYIVLSNLDTTSYSKVLDDLGKAYVLSIYFDSLDINSNTLDSSMKYCAIQYYKDKYCFDNSIRTFYSFDKSFVIYLFQYKIFAITNLPLIEGFGKDFKIYQSVYSDEQIRIIKCYKDSLIVRLTLILNYYINTEQKTIKLLLDADYIESNSIKTEELYSKLDKIFAKYGYEDKENIRNAIIEDFGNCIKIDGM